MFCITKCQIILEKPYYECYPGRCESIYGHYIQGDNDSVAIACTKDPKCKAFRFSAKLNFGYFCAKSDIRKTYDDWKTCKVNPGNKTNPACFYLTKYI